TRVLAKIHQNASVAKFHELVFISPAAAGDLLTPVPRTAVILAEQSENPVRLNLPQRHHQPAFAVLDGASGTRNTDAPFRIRRVACNAGEINGLRPRNSVVRTGPGHVLHVVGSRPGGFGTAAGFRANVETPDLAAGRLNPRGRGW